MLIKIKYFFDNIDLKIKIHNLFYIIIFCLPLIQTELRIRIGAGWQLYIPLIYFLFLILIYQSNLKFYKYFLIIVLFFILMLFSNFYGYLFFINTSLSEDLILQVKTKELLMLTESIRYSCSVIFFFLTLYLIRNEEQFIKSIQIFMISFFFQALYGIYEILVKLFFDFLPLLNIKALSHGLIRVYGTFYEPSQYGQFMLISILIYTFYFSITKNKIAFKNTFFIKYYHAIMLILIISFSLSLSRTAFLIGFIIILINSVLTLFRLKYFVKNMSFILVLFFVGYLYIEFIMPEDTYKNWIFLLTSDTGNGLIARIYYTINDFNQHLLFSIENFIGVGLGGAVIYTSGMVPFFFKLAIETGMIVLILYLIFIAYLFIKLIISRKIPEKRFILYLLIGLIAIQLNYNTITDPWIWFLFAIIYKYIELYNKGEL